MAGWPSHIPLAEAKGFRLVGRRQAPRISNEAGIL
jgi:hypothetical protein